MNIRHTYIILSLLMAIFLPGCHIHEEPHLTEDGEIGVDPTRITINVNINLDISLPGTRENVSPTAGHVHRFIVEAVDAQGISVARRRVFYDSDLGATTFSHQISMRLHARKYHIVIWSDYVSDRDLLSDIFYDTSNLYPVKILGKYTACDNAKDAFSGMAEIDLRQYEDVKGASFDVAIDLFRPVGRYQLIATDVQAFRRDLADGSLPRQQFKVRVHYSEFISLGYNCIEGIRKELATGIKYSTALPDLSDFQGNEYVLCFDYCFCGAGEAAKIPVTVDVVNENDEILAREYVTIPLRQGINAVIRGRFLTSTIEGGMTIDPSYDGEINIDLGTLTPE